MKRSRMHDNNCAFCGKDTGRGGKNHSKKKYMGRYAHYECFEHRFDKEPEPIEFYSSKVDIRDNHTYKLRYL